MSTRQSRYLFVNGSVHMDVPHEQLPKDLLASPDDEAALNQAFQAYIVGRGAFVFEHENRHVHQTLAYPALYLRALREFHWARAALSDFRDRGDIVYDRAGQSRPVLDPSDPFLTTLRRSYYASVGRYPAGCQEDGRVRWGEASAIGAVVKRENRRVFSEVKLIEAEALAVQYAVAGRRGVVGPFLRWAISHGANHSPIDDLVTILSCGVARERVEQAVLRMVPALVWHAFHTTWPVTAFLNFLECLMVRRRPDELADMDRKSMFALVGAMRKHDAFLHACPVLTPETITAVVAGQQPVTDTFGQFDDDPATWSALIDIDKDHPLSGWARARLQPNRWPDRMDFVDPAPDLFSRLQMDYPATSYLLRVSPHDDGGAQQSRGIFRRWLPRVSWRPGDLEAWRALLVYSEIAQTLLANVYVQVFPADAFHGGTVEQTCWQTACPVHATGLCRSWDAIPRHHVNCEYLLLMPAILNHVVDPSGPTATIRQT